MSIEKLLEREARFCSWGDTVHYNNPPKFFSSADGHYLIDLDNHRYLDVQTAHSAVNFGYGQLSITERVIDKIRTLPMLSAEFLTEDRINLSQRIAESIESWTGEKGRVHFNVGGAQAIDDSIKLVAKLTGKRHSFAFEGSYHGRTVAAASITSSYRYRQAFDCIAHRGIFLSFPYCFRCPVGASKQHCDLPCLRPLRRLFDSEYYGVFNPSTGESEVGAFFIEPIQGTGGYIVPPKMYFKELKQILNSYNILLVDDEVQMGMFRTGKMWALEHFDTNPDILVFGKSLTNGLNPLSGFWAKEPLASPENWSPGSTHSTYGSNPLGMAAGNAVFDVIEDSEFATQVGRRGRELLAALRNLKDRHSVIGDVDGLGLALRIELCEEDGYTPNPTLASNVKSRGLQGDCKNNSGVSGLVLGIGGYYKNVITLAPPLTIERDEITILVNLLDLILKDCIK